MANIELRNVWVGYGNHIVVRDVSFAVGPGEVVAVLGKNGSGKSTLLKSMVSDLPLMSGSVLVDGVSLSSLSRRRIACLVGIVEQDLPDSPIDVFHYIQLGLTPYRGLFDVVFSEKDRMSVLDIMQSYGIAHLASRPVVSISGGERRLCVLARVQLQSTPIVLLDEPTANLDVGNQRMVIDVVRNMAMAGKAVVCVVHDVNEALRIADRYVVIDKGEVVFDGKQGEMLEAAISGALGEKILLREVDGRIIALY